MSAPLIVAHGGANTPRAVPLALPYADVLEADVRLFHGRLEVRHAKSLGPLPVFWDRGERLAFSTSRPPLAGILDAIAPHVGLMLDLKGPDPRMVSAILAATAHLRPHRPLYMCARAWRTADRLRGVDGVTVLHSVGNARGLRALLRRHGPGGLDGVSVHDRLLDAAVVAALRERAAHVWTWPIDDPTRGAALAAWGVTGLISNAPARLAGLRTTVPPAEAP